MKMNWKLLSIILLVIVVIETGLLVYLISLGMEVIRKEEACGTYCSQEEGVGFYYWDSAAEQCYCIES